MSRPLDNDPAGKTYWRSLGELAQTKEFRESAREIPGGIAGPRDAFSRRQFLGVMGASMGLAGLAGCRRPEEKILPYSRAPEDLVPGNPEIYATAFPWGATALGLLVECHEGRPTKIEGNPRHPDSLGGTTTFAQASILDLYDPDRSPSPAFKGAAKSWDDAAAFLAQKGREHKEKGGKGLAILTEAHRSPTLAGLLAQLAREMPQTRVVRYEPLDRERAREGARIAFGRPLEAVPELARAQVIVALDADLFGWEGSPVRQARGFADRRRVEKPGDGMSRLYAVESAYSITGAAADHRLRLARRDLPGFVFALARELAAQGLELGPLAAAVGTYSAERYGAGKPWVRALAKDLLAHRGEAVLVAGAAQPAAVHAAVHAINAALGAGATVRYLRPFDEAPEGAAALKGLTDRMRAGEVETLVVLGGNPAFTSGPEAAFAEAVGRVGAAVHLSTHRDETSALAGWHLNRAHYLESWSDVRAADGTASVIQPLIAPLFGGRTDAEVVSLLLGAPKKAHDLVRATWRSEQGELGFEPAWRRALHDGIWEASAWAPETASVDLAAVAKAVRAHAPAPAGLEVTFHPDPHAFDGRYANNGWLQETPDPLSKITWGNAALLSPATATRLGLVEGDLVELRAAAPLNSIQLPVCYAPGQAEDSIAVTLGQGRARTGRVGEGVGHDAYPIRLYGPVDAVYGVEVKKAGAVETLARTQEHALMEGRPLVREATLARFNEEPEFAAHMVHAPPLKSLFDDFEYKGQRWGMMVDLNACVGCNACMVACQAENNVPLVGKPGVERSREMHWLRVDRYFEGAPDDPRAVFQPMACQHCENAPCEQVCPVGATTHSPEGLNDMAYNRCIGTRYCANNCPFKVRRFNFFNYTKDTPELHRMQKNPEVTVRSRGVMEKCTFCVQRIQQARIAAKKEGRGTIADGQIQTACQQACPTRAIRFGDLNDKQSEISRLAALPRGYAMLAELNIRPRTSYLARVRNPNPELESA